MIPLLPSPFYLRFSSMLSPTPSPLPPPPRILHHPNAVPSSLIYYRSVSPCLLARCLMLFLFYLTWPDCRLLV